MSTPPESVQEAALAGLLAYRTRVEALQAQASAHSASGAADMTPPAPIPPAAPVSRQPDAPQPSETEAIARIEAYSRRAPALIRADARQRFRAVQAQAGRALLAGAFVPSLIELAQLEISEEPRFSLLLAALLDVGRSGPLAQRFWPAFLARIQRLASPAQQARVDAACAGWTAARIAQARIEPRDHGAEWHHIDVFARVIEAERYACGLVIENKTNPDTPEQPEQLDRYWQRIADEFPGARPRTLFVFLTEAPRVPQTAVRSAGWWVCLTWADVGALLWTLAEDQALSLGHRLLALQLRDLIRSQVLDQPTLGAERQQLQQLVQRLADRDPGDPAWIAHHAVILSLWNRIARGTAP